MSSWAFVLGDSVLGDFVLGAFVRIPVTVHIGRESTKELKGYDLLWVIRKFSSWKTFLDF